jgi:hypothetical protein
MRSPAGAAALIAEHQVDGASAVPTAIVASSRAALAHAAARFYGHPGRSLRLIGFTGTFGKTTTSEVLRALLAAGGRRVGLVGSLGARYDGYADPGGGLTTPAPAALHRMLRELRDRGADTVILEVTSHGMMLDRVEGLRFPDFTLAAIVPGEHTDFHRSYRDYVAAKSRFLEYLAADAVLAYDADNRAARDLAARARVALRVGVSVGRRQPAAPHDIVIANVELDEHGALLTVRGERMRSSLLGSVNVRAVGLALAHALARDVDLRAARCPRWCRPRGACSTWSSPAAPSSTTSRRTRTISGRRSRWRICSRTIAWSWPTRCVAIAAWTSIGATRWRSQTWRSSAPPRGSSSRRRPTWSAPAIARRPRRSTRRGRRSRSVDARSPGRRRWRERCAR